MFQDSQRGDSRVLVVANGAEGRRVGALRVVRPGDVSHRLPAQRAFPKVEQADEALEQRRRDAAKTRIALAMLKQAGRTGAVRRTPFGPALLVRFTRGPEYSR